MSERYQPNGVTLTDYERELLVILMEECAEVIQAASKLIRFGKENRPNDGMSNTYCLGLEIGDVSQVISMTQDAYLVQATAIREGRDRKRERLEKFMQTSRQ
jgi:hypothetical protein